MGLLAAAAWAQPPDLAPPSGGVQGDLGLPLGAGLGVLGEGDRVPKLDAGFTTPEPSGSAQLFISATLPPGVHTYSITQAPGGPRRTTIAIDASADVRLTGDYQTVTPPQKERDEDAFPGLVLESHTGTVKWVVPIQLSAGAKAETIKLQGKVKMQLCDAIGCAQAKDYPFTATLRPDIRAVSVAGPEGPKAAPIPPATSAAPPMGDLPPPSVDTAHALAFQPPPAIPADVLPPPNVTVANSSLPAETGNARISQAQVPTPGMSGRPDASAGESRAATGEGEIDWLPFSNASELREMVGPGFDMEQIRENVRKQDVGLGIAGAIFAGFIGGLILNVMPCVLPVIGLKILSFVEQAGHNRRKAFMLNVWYSLGLLAVFFVLASLAVGPQRLGWGELFGKAWFTIALSAVVFVMSLSFMGVWEVPLPAFLGSGKASELASHEGAVGAFFKGALTTLLATPCSAPFLAPALVWATAQPPWLTYAVFLSTGLGMASPYLLIGAFPELLRFLPKPGAWMETFKILMGFVLMGTVVYLLAVLKPEYVVPTVGLLFGLSFMCWLIGRISPVVDFMAKLRTWSQGAAVVCVIWIVMFPGLDLGRLRIPGLAAVMAKKFAPPPTVAVKGPASVVVGPKTVLVAFTADWCQTCHYYENTVLHTAPVIDSLRRLGVVTVKADWSQDSPQVTEMLDVLGSRQIPVIAIFSAKDPNHPSVFRGGYAQQELLNALDKAGASPGAG